MMCSSYAHKLSYVRNCFVSGYVPRKLFKSGKSFTPMCDLSVDEHTTNYHKTLRFENCMRNTIKLLPKYQVLNHDPHVRDHLNTYRDTRPMPPVLAGKTS